MFLRFPALLGAVMLAVACVGSHDAVKVNLRAGTADAMPSNQYVSVESTGDWTLSLEFDGETDGDFTPWAYFGNDIEQVEISGSGPRRDIVLNWIANASPDERSFTLVAQAGSSRSSARFVQSGRTQGGGALPESLKSDELGAWMELPATTSESLYYISHAMTIGNTTTRNYTYGWDPTHLVALWVAYPLNAWTISSGNRTNVWGMDPKIPRKYQPVLFSAFASGNAGGGFDRGHQVPSADRLSYDANIQTFYGTNITPQLDDLNSGAWSVLEGMVRNWSRQFDTLYVVTGCTVEGSTQYCYDNDRKKVTVPTGYYKALLGYKKNGTLGNTSTQGGYTGIGFWFDHRSYNSSDETVMAQSVTIDALEARTGFDFFVNLPYKIGADMANQVESTIDNWWK